MFGELINKGLENARKFDIKDFAVFKICLFIAGILFGVSFKKQLANKLTVAFLSIAFVLSCTYLMCRVFLNED